MSTAQKSDTVTQGLREFAQSQGLDRALALFPDALVAAHARGARAIGTLPDTVPPTTEPAVCFAPDGGLA